MPPSLKPGEQLLRAPIRTWYEWTDIVRFGIFLQLNIQPQSSARNVIFFFSLYILLWCKWLFFSVYSIFESYGYLGFHDSLHYFVTFSKISWIWIEYFVKIYITCDYSFIDWDAITNNFTVIIIIIFLGVFLYTEQG